MPGVRACIVDPSGLLTDAMKAHEGGVPDRVTLMPGVDIRSVPRSPRTAFVSPANSLGFMDGGVDYYLSREMFPGVEQDLRRAISDTCARTKLGRPYLDIGAALVVPVRAPAVGFLISAPTMWMPQDVRGTQNAYWATLAALRAAVDHGGIDCVVFPGMGTGYGRLTFADAADQMLRAFSDHDDESVPDADPTVVAATQPCTYENTEFKAIEPQCVRHHV